MGNIKNLEKIPLKVRKILENYLEKLIEIHRDELLSIFAYGSVSGEDFIPGKSQINLAVILKRVSFNALRKSLKTVSWGVGKKITAPLFLDPEYIQRSTDVFPIEFLDLKEEHILLYGEDLISNIGIEPSNIRLFCEEQIKGKLIRIREAYLEIGLKRKGIEALLKESLAALFPVFRNLIRLKDIQPPHKRERIITQLAQEFNLDGDVFLTILRDQQNDERIGGKEIEVYLEKYLAQIEKLANAVDKL